MISCRMISVGGLGVPIGHNTPYADDGVDPPLSTESAAMKDCFGLDHSPQYNWISPF